MTERARCVGQIPDVDSWMAATAEHRAVEAVPLPLGARSDADLPGRARELPGFFEAALTCTGTDTDAVSA